MTNVSAKSNTIMVTMASSLPRNFGETATTNDKVNLSLASELSTKTRVLSVLSKPSCIWHVPSWFTPHSIGQKEDLTISLSGHLL